MSQDKKYAYQISKESVDKLFPKIEPVSYDLISKDYKSPITVMIERINGQIKYEAENAVYEEVRRIGVEVDKNELIKALRYDRGQHEAGYRSGYSAGYLHAVEEIFAEIDEELNFVKRAFPLSPITNHIIYVFAELKKKYTEER